jgi:nucleotide-binding universal stress UspA family protein
MNGTEVPLPGRASNRREPIPARRSIDGDDLDEGCQKMSAQGTVAVGVDGSDCSRTALEFAFDEAVRRGAAVRVVSAVPEAEYWATEYGMSPSLLAELSASVEKVAQDMVDEVVRERGGSAAEVPVEIRTVGGSPAHVLVSQARDTDLLVVGHRGRGGFGSALLGSVGLQCVLHASVPVAVVRPALHPAPLSDARDMAQARV